MASLAKLRQQVPAVIAEYFERTRDAEEARAKEVAAVTRIQAAARGFLMRRRIHRLTLVTTCLQRWWRGHLGRLRGKLARETKDKQLREDHFNRAATTIQRHWRGHWSRTRLFDFYARQRYLAAVAANNRRLRQELSSEADRAAVEQRILAEETAHQLFEQKISRLHHLVSTAVQPGIFNSPFAYATGTLPLVAGTPVEEHLKNTVKASGTVKLPPLSGRSKSSGRLTGGGSPGTREKAAPVATMPNGEKVNPRATLRQSVKYDAVHQALVLEDKIRMGEILSHHTLPFNQYTIPHHGGAFLDLQTNRNLESFGHFHDPTGFQPEATFTPRQQSISEQPFKKYIKNPADVWG